jgi:hypothetical protein
LLDHRATQTASHRTASLSMYGISARPPTRSQSGRAIASFNQGLSSWRPDPNRRSRRAGSARLDQLASRPDPIREGVIRRRGYTAESRTEHNRKQPAEGDQYEQHLPSRPLTHLACSRGRESPATLQPDVVEGPERGIAGAYALDKRTPSGSGGSCLQPRDSMDGRSRLRRRARPRPRNSCRNGRTRPRRLSHRHRPYEARPAPGARAYSASYGGLPGTARRRDRRGTPPARCRVTRRCRVPAYSPLCA